MFGVSLKMMYILVLWPVLLASAVLTLTIDSLLGTSIEDCFERVAIGEQIPLDAIYRNVSELTTKECEQICKQDKQCQTYDYGVGAKGNSTCDLSNVNEKQIKEEKLLTRNPDYDVYVRRIQCEQSPPTPMDHEVLENIPLHRPVIRPEADRRPLGDEYYESSYEPDRQTRPYGNQDRPDGYDSRPAEDRPPSYGVHTPQEIPYRPRPERPDDRPPNYGVHRPQEVPYRPRPDERPPTYGSHRPEEIPYVPRPERPDDRPPSYGSRPQEHFRPGERPPSYGFYEPQRVPYRPESPFDRPPSYGNHRPQEIPYRPIDNVTRKPRPRPESNYPQEQDIYRPKPETPDYQYFIRPNRRPSYDRPVDPKPNYSYNSQYASSYGSSEDNSIHVEIHDPPRFKPPHRPYQEYSQGSSGYGQSYGYQSTSSQGNYGQQSFIYESKPQTYGEVGPNKYDQISHGYGSTTRRPPFNSQSHKPQGDRDSYGVSSSSYGTGQSSSSTYGSSQTSNSVQNVGGGYGSSGSYGGSSASGNGYAGSQPSPGYDSTSSGYTDRLPSRPTSSNEYSQLSNSYNQNSYGTYNKYDEQNSLFGSHLGYGTHHLYEMYGFRKPYGSKPYEKPGYDKPSGVSESGYGARPNEESHSRPGFSSTNDYQQTSYDSKPSGIPGSSAGYGGWANKPSYGETIYKPSGNTYQRPEAGHKPGSAYADEGYQTTKPYSERPSNETLSSYDSDRPDVKPVYEFEEKPDGPSYISRPDGNVITTRPVVITDYDQQSYGRNPDWRFSYKG